MKVRYVWGLHYQAGIESKSTGGFKILYTRKGSADIVPFVDHATTVESAESIAEAKVGWLDREATRWGARQIK